MLNVRAMAKVHTIKQLREQQEMIRKVKKFRPLDAEDIRYLSRLGSAINFKREHKV